MASISHRPPKTPLRPHVCNPRRHPDIGVCTYPLSTKTRLCFTSYAVVPFNASVENFGLWRCITPFCKVNHVYCTNTKKDRIPVPPPKKTKYESEQGYKPTNNQTAELVHTQVHKSVRLVRGKQRPNPAAPTPNV